ncbi:MAG: NADH-quinone oxidoreductase subunit M [Candidatus Heimdallarchaeota archaeon]|nr:NADH-quinone oxidoreductase subunit M [Candidatus Heimdallarchaeota archaeon]
MFNFTLIISIAILLLAPIIVFFLGKWNDHAAKWSAFIFVLISAVFFALSLGDVLNDGLGNIHSEGWNNWINFNLGSKNVTIGFKLIADSLSFPIAAIIFILSLAAVMYSFGYMKKEENQGAYYALLVLYIAGMVGVILAGDLVQFYVFWELMLIPSYFIIAKWGSKPNSVKIAFKYFMFTHVGAMAILIGIGGLWAYGSASGSFLIANINMTAVSKTITLVLTILFLLGFAVKMAIFPLHTWLPDTHGEAPTPISAILSGVMIETAAYAILRICTDILDMGSNVAFTWVLVGLAVFTMIYGGIMALAQKDTKRLFAYSSISQMGYIFFGLGTFTAFGATGSMFHIVSHALAKGTLFMVAGILMTQIGHHKGRDIKQLGGLAYKMPITAIVALIAALSLSGLPPLAGFMSEWIVFEGGLASGNPLGIIAIFMAVLSTALTATYTLLFMKNVFLGPEKEEFKDVKDPSPYMWAPLVVLALLSFIIGILPNSVLTFVTDAVAKIFGIT